MVSPPGLDVNPDQLDVFREFVAEQSDHLYGLVGYASSTCGTTDGLDGALSVLRGPIEDLAAAGRMVVSLSATGLGPYGGVAGKVQNVLTEYRYADEDSAGYLNQLFPDPLEALPVDIPLPDDRGPAQPIFSYSHAEAPDPAEPEDDVAELTADEIDPGGVLGTFADAFEFVFGWDPLQELVEPLVGRFGRLAWLSTAYVNMGDAVYRVAWNLREGTYIVAPHFNGQAGSAFEILMFRWHMGLGGLGDAYHVVSTLLAEASRVIGELVSWALDKLYGIIEWLAAKLAGVGLVKTVGVALWNIVTEFDLTAAYDEVREIYDDVMGLKDKIGEIKDACETLKENLTEVWTTIEEVAGVASDPRQAMEDAIEDEVADLASREVQIEQMGVGAAQWPAEVGVVRVGMLPLGTASVQGYY